MYKHMYLHIVLAFHCILLTHITQSINLYFWAFSQVYLRARVTAVKTAAGH